MTIANVLASLNADGGYLFRRQAHWPGTKKPWSAFDAWASGDSLIRANLGSKKDELLRRVALERRFVSYPAPRGAGKSLEFAAQVELLRDGTHPVATFVVDCAALERAVVATEQSESFTGLQAETKALLFGLTLSLALVSDLARQAAELFETTYFKKQFSRDFNVRQLYLRQWHAQIKKLAGKAPLSQQAEFRLDVQGFVEDTHLTKDLIQSMKLGANAAASASTPASAASVGWFAELSASLSANAGYKRLSDIVSKMSRRDVAYIVTQPSAFVTLLFATLEPPTKVAPDQFTTVVYFDDFSEVEFSRRARMADFLGRTMPPDVRRRVACYTWDGSSYSLSGGGAIRAERVGMFPEEGGGSVRRLRYAAAQVHAIFENRLQVYDALEFGDLFDLSGAPNGGFCADGAVAHLSPIQQAFFASLAVFSGGSVRSLASILERVDRWPVRFADVEESAHNYWESEAERNVRSIGKSAYLKDPERYLNEVFVPLLQQTTRQMHGVPNSALLHEGSIWTSRSLVGPLEPLVNAGVLIHWGTRGTTGMHRFIVNPGWLPKGEAPFSFPSDPPSNYEAEAAAAERLKAALNLNNWREL